MPPGQSQIAFGTDADTETAPWLAGEIPDPISPSGVRLRPDHCGNSAPPHDANEAANECERQSPPADQASHHAESQKRLLPKIFTLPPGQPNRITQFSCPNSYAIVQIWRVHHLVRALPRLTGLKIPFRGVLRGVRRPTGDRRLWLPPAAQELAGADTDPTWR